MNPKYPVEVTTSSERWNYYPKNMKSAPSELELR